MSGNSANVRSWNGATVYVASLGTAAPTNVNAAWTGYSGIGLISEDEGITNAREMEVKKVRAYGGGVARVIKSKFGWSFKFVALETSITTMGLVWPGSTISYLGDVPTYTLKVPTTPDPRAWGLELSDGSIINRLPIPKGEVTEVGEIAMKDTDETAYEITVEVHADGDKILGYLLTNDPAFAH